ncbi:MAG: class I SAM-dependent methyltransferase [Saccharolobus sp.]
MANFRIIEFNGIKLCLNENTYEPAEDTELLLRIIKIHKGDKVLDMGSGSGILGIYALKLGGKVIFIDINPYAILSTLCSLGLNRLDDKDYNIVNCNLLDCIREEKFDVAIFNPPYLPFEEYDSWIGYSWSGGKNGSDIIIKFLREITSKRVYILYSSLSDEDSILTEIKRREYIISQKYERVIGYERLVALELIRK